MPAHNEKHEIRLSKFLSLVLRHKPEAIGIALDEGGWTDVETLLQKAQAAGVPLTHEGLKNIVATNSKKRFVFNNAGDKIRARQGHSVQIDLGLAPQQPPDLLYHGTAQHNVAAILKQGLVNGKRQHVHLSADYKTAVQVGQRHGRPFVFEVAAGRMFQQGFLFYQSQNDVWLTGPVPAQYLTAVTQ